MWDLPGPGLEPVSPALAGRFSTTAPPGKPNAHLFMCSFSICISSLVKCPNLFLLGYLFSYYVLRVLCIFRIQVLSQIWDLQILFSIPWLSFHCPNSVFWSVEVWILLFNLLFFHRCPLSGWEKSPEFPETFFEIRNECWILSNAFSAFMIFFFFSLLILCITLIF